MTTSKQFFGKTPDDRDAELWTISNSQGISISLSNWGATIVSVIQPDRNGNPGDIVLGYKSAEEYQEGPGYIGATCGRFANRIAGGKFTLEGVVYDLATNNGPNHLHGGNTGFDSQLWTAEPYSEGDSNGVSFSLTSRDGDEGYPGELSVRTDYALDERGRIFWDFRANTNKTTIVNLTNHAYWNLSGVPGKTIHDIELILHASRYLPVDDTAIPEGKPLPVEGTPFDFLSAKTIGRELDRVKGGYDHCMVVDGDKGDLRIAAEAVDPVSGRKLTLFTDRPGVQFYSGNFLDGNPFAKHSGFCLEPEDFPDAPNRPDFPSVVLRPGESYHHRSVVELTTV